MTIESIELWHKRARPEPSERDFSIQVAVHLEEIVEMLDTLVFVHGSLMPGNNTLARHALDSLSASLKKGHVAVTVPPENRKAFLDSLADQIVTAVGVGHCAGMQTAEACARVNSSNWSKFDENGQPVFDANGKIAKPAAYVAPNLEGLY